MLGMVSAYSKPVQHGETGVRQLHLEEDATVRSTTVKVRHQPRSHGRYIDLTDVRIDIYLLLL